MKKVYCLFIILFVFTLNSYSQTITTSPLSSAEFCAGQTINVSFTITGNFDSGNDFVAQISDNNFANFVNIGAIKGKVSNPITAKIPDNISDSTKFRIRVIASTPYTEGSDNGSDLSFKKINTGSFSIEPTKIFSEINTDILFSLYKERIKDYTLDWNFGTDANINTFTGFSPPPVKYNTLGLKKVKCKAKSELLCNQPSNAECSLYIYSCEITLDSSAFVDSLNSGFDKTEYKDTIDHAPEFSQIWVMPSVTFDIGAWKKIFILETGANVNLPEVSKCLFYMKPGSSVNISTLAQNCSFVKAPGSSLIIADSMFVKITNCSAIKIKYNSAPKGGVEYMVAKGYLDVGETQGNSNEFSISPNPATDYIEISFPDDMNKGLQPLVQGNEVRIYDVFGEEVNLTPSLSILGEGDNNPQTPFSKGELGSSSSQYSLLNTHYSTKTDVSGLPAGVYFVRCGEKVRKFVKL